MDFFAVAVYKQIFEKNANIYLNNAIFFFVV